MLKIFQLGILGQFSVDAFQNRTVTTITTSASSVGSSSDGCNSKCAEISKITEREAELGAVAKVEHLSHVAAILVGVDEVRVVVHPRRLAAEAVDLRGRGL